MTLESLNQDISVIRKVVSYVIISANPERPMEYVFRATATLYIIIG
jgi:hypothetical protein